tara:strand:- start:2238 stop:2693 length:456 start_codon:yes stop_codon:yes gene_type:complete
MSLVTSVDDKKKVIFNFDLQPIINKLVRVHKWTKEDVLACETLYRNFLYLNFAYGDKYKIAPTHEVDLFWHEHILDTKKYIEDCNIIFGDVLHHYPYAGMDGSEINESRLKEIFQKTQELHNVEFGYYMYKIRLSCIDMIKACFKLFKKSV